MVCELMTTDLGEVAGIYEEYHLTRCRIHPDLYCPPFEDSFYFKELSDILLYSDDELMVCVDEETDFIKAFAVFGIKEDSSPILRKRKVCRIELLVVRRGSEDSGADNELIEFIRNYAAENECVAVEYAVAADNTAVCDNNGFEPQEIIMEIKLK